MLHVRMAVAHTSSRATRGPAGLPASLSLRCTHPPFFLWLRFNTDVAVSFVQGGAFSQGGGAVQTSMPFEEVFVKAVGGE